MNACSPWGVSSAAEHVPRGHRQPVKALVTNAQVMSPGYNVCLSKSGRDKHGTRFRISLLNKYMPCSSSCIASQPKEVPYEKGKLVQEISIDLEEDNET